MIGISSLILSDTKDMPVELASKLSAARCLVLNKDYVPLNYLPLSVVDWKESIVSVMQEKTEVVEMYEDVYVRSPSHKFSIPSVIVNKEYRKIKHRIEFCKAHVFLRDNFTCQYCGAVCIYSELTYDHWLPRAEGGKTNWTNITTACRICNNRKGTQNSRRWIPRVRPYKPTYEELSAKARKRPVIIPDEKWIPFLKWEGRIKISNWSDHYMVDYNG